MFAIKSKLARARLTKRLLSAVWLLCVVAGLAAAADVPGYVNFAGTFTGGNDCQPTIEVKSGNVLVALLATNTVSSNTLSMNADTFSTTWTAQGSQFLDSGNHTILRAWIGQVGSTGQDTLDMHVSNSAQWASCAVVQYAGLTSTSFDQVGAGTSFASVATGTTTATSTTAQANEIVVGLFAMNSTAEFVAHLPDWNRAWGMRGGAVTAFITERVVSATGTYSSTLDCAGGFGSCMSGGGLTVTLKAPAMHIYKVGGSTSTIGGAGCYVGANNIATDNFMALSFINGATFVALATNANTAATFGSPSTSCNGGGGGGCTGTSFTAQGSQFTDSGSHTTTQMWVGNFTNASNTYGAVTFSLGSGSDVSCSVAEYIGLTASAIDQSATASNETVSSLVTGTTGTTTQASELLTSGFGMKSTTPIHAGSGWTILGQFPEDQEMTGRGNTVESAIEDQLVTSTGTYQGTATMSSGTASGGGIIVTLKAAPTGRKRAYITN